MEWIRKLAALTERLPTRADDPPPEPVDWSRGVITAALALICFAFAAIALIVSDAFASGPVAAVFLLVGVAVLCAQPAARTASAHLRRVRITERALFFAAAVAGVVVTLVFVGAWALWIALAAGFIYGCIRGILLAARAVRVTHAE